MRKLSAALCLTLLAGSASAQLVAGRDGTGGGLWVIDLTNAQPPRLLTTGSTQVAWGAAADEDTDTLYWNNGGTLFAAPYTTTGTLSPTSVAMTQDIGGTINFTGLAYDTLDNKLYGYRNITVPGLYEINTTTGVATLVFATSADFGGFDYDPVTDAFYGLNDSTSPSGTGLYRISKPLSSAVLTRLTPYPTADVDNDGLAIGNGRAYFIQDTGTQGIQVYNLSTNSFEADLPLPFTGSGTFSAGAWAPGLVIIQDFDAGVVVTAPANCAVAQGGSASFVVTVNNPGAQPVTNATVTFNLPPGTTFQSSVPPGSPVGSTLTVNLGTISAQGSAALTVNMTLNSGGSFTATASVAVAETDPNPGNNSGSATTFVGVAPPATAAVKGVLSTISGSPTSLVTGGEGERFSSTGGLERLFRSPDGSRWILSADTDIATTTLDQVIVVGSGAAYTVAAREGQVSPEGDHWGLPDAHYGINNAGQFAFSNNTDSTTTTADEVVVVWNGSAFVTVVREGGAVPGLPGVTWGTTNGSVQIGADGTASFQTNMAGTGGTTNDTAVFTSNGATLVGQEGTTIPTGQAGGTTFTIKAMDTGATDGQGFYTNASGSRTLWTGTINAPTTSDRVLVVDNDVKIQEASIIAGSSFGSPASIINYGFMEAGGDWFSYGSNADGNDWALKDGVVIGATDAPIFTGATELYDDTPYAQTFFLAMGNNRGDYVVGGTTNAADGMKNAVVVLNGTSVLMRENDPVDLDNNGVFDDGVYIRTFRDDFAMLTETEFWMVVRLRDEATASGCSTADPDLGQAVVRIALPTPPACCLNDYNGDGDVGTDADIEAFFACLSGSCCATCPQDADFNCDGDVGTDADIESFFRVLSGGPC